MGGIEDEDDRPQDRTLRDTTGEFDRIGLHVVDRLFGTDRTDRT